MPKLSKANQESIRDLSILKQRIRELEMSDSERKRAEQEVTILAEIGRVIGSTLDIKQVYEQFASITRKLIPFDALSVNLIDLSNYKFRIAYHSGLELPGRTVGLDIPLMGTMTEHAMLEKKPMTFDVSSIDEMTRLYPGITRVLSLQTGFFSNMLIPLFANDAIVGVLHFRVIKHHAYSNAEASLAERIGMQIAGAIANAQLFDHLSKAERSLRESEERLRDLIFSVADWVWEVDKNGIYTYSSQKGFDLFGSFNEDIIGKTPFDFMPPDEAKRVAAIFSDLAERKAPIKDLENLNIDRSGEGIYLLTNGVPILDEEGNLKGYRGVDKDITDHKRAERALRESEAKFRSIYEESPIGIELFDREGSLLDINRTCLEIFGIPDASAVRGFKLFEDPNLSEELKAQLRRGECVRYEIPFDFERVNTLKLYETTKSGTIYLDLLITPFAGGAKESIIGYLVHIRDITEGKQAGEELAQSHDLLTNLARQVPGVIYQYRLYPDGRSAFPYSSPGMNDIYEVTPEEVREDATPVFGRLHPDDYDHVVESIQESARTLRTFYCEFRVILPRQGLRWRWSQAQPERLADGSILWHGVISDTTERKRVEDQNRILTERLQRSEKMEALGQMAGGVAHDLNNVLGILSGYSELLLTEIPVGHRFRGHMEKILQSTEKGAAIIQDLLTLARRGVMVSDVTNLNGVVSAFFKTPVFEKMKDYNPRVTFRIECDKNLLNIKGSPVHLEKTLMNLVSNAVESISGDGVVAIRTESRYLDKPVRGYDEVKEGDYAVLTVSDTGMGIPAENIKKIFEPFYTKKMMGRSGTGLGLAIVWGTVKDHNGYIDVQTEIGRGTAFTLYFPVTREELVTQQQKVRMERYMGRGESVLVVDDIAEQREVASLMLTRLGYQVHRVASGEEAVEYLRGHKADILVLDMIMTPGIDGLETYQKILAVNPRQRAILVSGFSETERVKKAQKLGAGAYVKKPYVIEKIGVAIRDELDRR